MASDMATGTEDEIEEERRLLYVAMTRAKDELDLIVPQRFYTFHQSKVGDQHVYACRSRFIPDGIMSSFDARSWAERVEVAHRPARKGATTDVAARLRRMCDNEPKGATDKESDFPYQ
jgi:DNA helicase II / ATP-dependent DNA helicase PcrA